MSYEKSDLQSWRDEIIDEMKRITKAPGSVVSDGSGLDNQKRMAILGRQLEAVNRFIGLIDGPKQINIKGVDS